MNDQPVLPPYFDWVTARSSCSAVKVFELLHLEAKRNVETFNAATQLKWEFAAGVIRFLTLENRTTRLRPLVSRFAFKNSCKSSPQD